MKQKSEGKPSGDDREGIVVRVAFTFTVVQRGKSKTVEAKEVTNCFIIFYTDLLLVRACTNQSAHRESE